MRLFRRRTSGSVGGIGVLVVAALFAGWNYRRGAQFQDACAAIAAGTPVADAEASLTQLGGRRVHLANPKPGQSEFRFRSMVGSDRLCELETADGEVVATKGWRSMSLTR